MPTKGSNCASRALSAACAAAAMATAAPMPASPADSGPVPQGEARSTHASPCPRSTNERASTTGECQATVARSISARMASAGIAPAASRGGARPTVSITLGGSSGAPARRPASDHHAARSAASRGSAARSVNSRPRSAGAAPSAISTASSWRTSAAAVEIRLGADGREVSRRDVDGDGKAPSVDVRRRDDRPHARRGLERGQPRGERPLRIAQRGRHGHGALGRRRSRRHHDARPPGLHFAGRFVHDRRAMRARPRRGRNRRADGPCGGAPERQGRRIGERSAPHSRDGHAAQTVRRATPGLELRDLGQSGVAGSVRLARAARHVGERRVGQGPAREGRRLASDGGERRLVGRDGRQQGRAHRVHDARHVGRRVDESPKPPAVPAADRRRVDPASREPSLDERRERHARERPAIGRDSGRRHGHGDRALRVSFARDHGQERPTVPGAARRERSRRVEPTDARRMRTASDRGEQRRDRGRVPESAGSHRSFPDGDDISAAFDRTNAASSRIGTRAGQRPSSSASRSSPTASNNRAAAS